MRDCAHCGQQSRHDGPDACLGWIDDVLEACCGHGWQTIPYVVLEDEERLVGRDAIDYFDSHGVGPPPVERFNLPLFDQHDRQIVVGLQVRYDDLAVEGITWANTSGEKPVWEFDGQRVVIASGAGFLPLDGQYAVETTDGIGSPFLATGTV